MTYLFIGSLILICWVSFEIWRAPHLDDEGNVIEPEKKIKDLFK